MWLVSRFFRRPRTPSTQQSMLERQTAPSTATDDPGPETTGRSRGATRKFTLQEKLAIVREAKVPGVRAAFVARRFGIALNQLYYWRKVYGDLLPDHADTTLTPEQRQIADLRVQVQKLETLLGQRTFEMVLLQERLAAFAAANAKK